MPPHQMPTKYNDLYSCMNAGYEESLDKTKEIGADQVNEHQIYLKDQQIFQVRHGYKMQVDVYQ